MTRLTKSMTTAAAVLIVTAGVASAQTVLKAEVPFAFHVGDRVMEPGTIRVRQLEGRGGTFGLIVDNHEAKRTYVVLIEYATDAPRKWVAAGDPKLAFDCSSGACILTEAWYGHGQAYKFHGPKMRGGEPLLTEIAMKPDKGE